MKKNIFVGTYHKTGSAWMHSVFWKISKMLNIKFVNISKEHEGSSLELKIKHISDALISEKPHIIYDHHSQFPLDEFSKDELRQFSGFRVIRDPRDLIISSAKYHMWSDESWLHEPQDKFAGKTYHEKINSLETLDDRLLFEMDNSAGGQIEIMCALDGQNVLQTIRYEDLIMDVDMLLWHKLCIGLGFEGKEIISAMNAFWNNSLFGGKKKGGHIQDGSVAQYKNIFNDRINEVFWLKFENHMKTIGYK